MPSRADRWWVSPFNFDPHIRSEWRLPSNVVVHDNTLRDGEQQAGVVFSKQEKLHIAHALNEVGIDRIEVGMPVVSKDDFEVMKTLASEDLNSKLYCLARATKEDVDAATECGAYGLVMEIPSSKHIHEALGWTKEEAISKLVTATQHAVDRGLHVGVFPWDTTRADLSDYLDIAKAAADAHADSIAVVDTFGVAVPNVVKHLIKKLKATVKVPVEIHCHNDFGLAVANTLAGVEAGAEVVHTAFNGLGDRCGNASTEEVMLALHILYGLAPHYKFENFYSLSQFVQEASGLKLSTGKPVVGENVNKIEAGLVVDILAKAQSKGIPNTIAVPYDSRMVGQKGLQVVIGKKSGWRSIQLKLKTLGIEVSREQAEALLPKAKETSIKLKRNLTDDELRALAESP